MLYGAGGRNALARSRHAAERALELAPSLIPPAAHLILLDAEAGELATAYRQAAALVERHHRKPSAHFALSYVLRYGGMLTEALRHCEIALALDAYNLNWRSCALAYLMNGELEPVRKFVDLDPGSEWSALVSVHLQVRQRDPARALQQVRSLQPYGADWRFLEACLRKEAVNELRDPARAFIARWQQEDPEPAYFAASMLTYCGLEPEALALLRYSIRGGFCSYPALDRDSIWGRVTKQR